MCAYTRERIIGVSRTTDNYEVARSIEFTYKTAQSLCFPFFSENDVRPVVNSLDPKPSSLVFIFLNRYLMNRRSINILCCICRAISIELF